MKRPSIHFAPPERPAEGDRRWLDRVAQCSTFIAHTIETRQIRSNEVPIILASLIIALSDHTETPLETVLAMVSRAARELSAATPAQAPAPIAS